MSVSRKNVAVWLMIAVGVLAANAASNDRFTATPTPPKLFPGQSDFNFSLYGAPADLEKLKQVVQVMRDQHLGNAFDPGPTASAASRHVIEYLATVGWPVICYPPDGGRMQVKGGTSALSNDDEAAMRIFDRAGVFSAIQLGEWGYHFHQLTSDDGWWKAVLGKDYDAQAKDFIKPRENRGYDDVPKTRRECFDQVRDYFLWHSQAKRGRLISVTGHSHYEAYAAEWGAKVIGLEVGENIGFTQSKFAFARGASRQWNVPWSVQVSPWFGNAVTTHGPLNTNGATATGLDAGHSLSLYLRMWRHAWFAGAALITPENSIASFFEEPQAPWTLTAHGRAAAANFQFMREHDRGNPYTPLLVVLDHLSGYCAYQGLTWGILPPTQGDQETRDLFETQLFGGPQRLPVPGNPDNPEARYLHPTRYGELCDVFLSTAPGALMKNYPVILLVGDIEFSQSFVRELTTAARAGSRIFLHPRHVEAMGPDAFKKLSEAGTIEVLDPGVNAETKRPAAISDERLRQITEEYLPIGVSGDPVEYQINRNTAGWVIELINNDGVVKEGRKPAVTYSSVIAHVTLSPRFESKAVCEWLTKTELKPASEIEVEIPPGETRFVQFDTRD
ncbi:hypothetical protein GC207_03195 [bacterium]|nr:hypothetical protein [bacterium]